MSTQSIKSSDPATFISELAGMQEEMDSAFSLFLVDAGYSGKIVARVGSRAGEAVLQQAEKLLLKFCRDQDRASRIGEKTFAIILPRIRNTAHAVLAVEKIMRLQSEFRNLDSLRIDLNLRIGIVNCPEHSSDPADLIDKARIALEIACGSNQSYVVYSDDTAATLALRWELQEELRAAVKEGAMELHYQPKVDIETGRPIGAEALMRWRSLRRGPISPNIFVPLAEELGLLEKLSWFAINTAIRQSAEWPDTGAPLSVSVNVDSDTLQNAELIDMIKSTLSIWGAANRKLILEITERALVEDSDSNFETLKQLRELGVGISIDDFGTGYSSLSYFKNIPATELKIDQSFVLNMREDNMDKNIVESIIWLAHRFDLLVVAEGIEDSDTLKILAEMGCDIGQGYFFSKALSHTDYSKWLVS